MVRRQDHVRLRKGELFHALGYRPHPAQALVHASRAKRRVMACGTRFGKTTVGVFEVIAALLEPGERRLGWLIAPTYDVSQRIFKRVVELLHAHFGHRVRMFDPRQHCIVVVNFGGSTSELRAKSADRPVSLLGEALDFVVIDEASQMRDDIWADHVAPRLIDRGGWALLLSTPRGTGWFYQEFRRAKCDKEYAAWQFPSTTNPHISSELIEAERARLAPAVFAEQYEAKFEGQHLEPCDVCHGPTFGLTGRVILHEGEGAPPQCAACGGYVDADGNSLMHHDGKEVLPLRIIMVFDSPTPPPPLPTFENP